MSSIVTIKSGCRLSSIDGLRAGAVGLVFLSHARGDEFPGGFIGVDIFFVISGYVITRGLLSSDGGIVKFYVHRLFRIVPAMVPILFLAAILLVLGYSIAPPLEILAAAASFMNWIRAYGLTVGHALGHFWSLSIEEQFYAVWPWLLSLLQRVTDRAVWVIAVLVLVLFAWQNALFLVTHDAVRVYNGFDTRASQLGAGCVLAMLPTPNLSRWWPLPIIILIPLIFTMKEEQSFYLTAGIPLVTVVAALLVAILSSPDDTPLHRFLNLRILQWGGTRSYAIYLWHFPLLKLLWDAAHLLGVRAYFGTVLALAFTCLMAELSNRFIEAPARRFRDKFDRRIDERSAYNLANNVPSNDSIMDSSVR